MASIKSKFFLAKPDRGLIYLPNDSVETQLSNQEEEFKEIESLYREH